MGEPLYGLQRIVRMATNESPPEVNVTVQSAVPPITVTPSPVPVTIQASPVQPEIRVEPTPVTVNVTPEVRAPAVNVNVAAANPEVRIEPSYPITVNVQPAKVELGEIKLANEVHFIGYGKLDWPTEGDSVLIVKREQTCEYLPVAALHNAIQTQIQKYLDKALADQKGSLDTEVKAIVARQFIPMKSNIETSVRGLVQTEVKKQMTSTIPAEVKKEVTSGLAELMKNITEIESGRRTARSADEPGSSTTAIDAMVERSVRRQIDQVSRQYATPQEVHAMRTEIQALRADVQSLRTYIQAVTNQQS